METIKTLTELLGIFNYKIQRLIVLIKSREDAIEDYKKQIAFFETTNIPSFNTSLIPFYEDKLKLAIIQLARLQKCSDKLIREYNSKMMRK
jgi:hypothetical protein